MILNNVGKVTNKFLEEGKRSEKRSAVIRL